MRSGYFLNWPRQLEERIVEVSRVVPRAVVACALEHHVLGVAHRLLVRRIEAVHFLEGALILEPVVGHRRRGPIESLDAGVGSPEKIIHPVEPAQGDVGAGIVDALDLHAHISGGQALVEHVLEHLGQALAVAAYVAVAPYTGE